MIQPWWQTSRQILYPEYLFRLIKYMETTRFCTVARRLLNPGYCYTSVSSQIHSPDTGYVKDSAEYMDNIINKTVHNQ